MKCAVKNCLNKYDGKVCTKSFFRFPKEKSLRGKWIKFCKQIQPFNAKSWRICSDHFKEEDILNKLQYEMGFADAQKLKPGAIPFRQIENYSLRQHRVDRRENKKVVDDLLKQHTENSKTIITEPFANTSDQCKGIFIDVHQNQTEKYNSTYVSALEPQVIVDDSRSHFKTNERSNTVVSENSICSQNALQRFLSIEHSYCKFLSNYSNNALKGSYDVYDDVTAVDDVTVVGDVTLPTLLRENAEIFGQKTSNEHISVNNVKETTIINMEFKIRSLEKQLKLLRTRNRKKEKKWQHEIDTLKKKLNKKDLYIKHIEAKLKGIFTEGQIRKLKNGGKLLKWSQNDIAHAITLYSASAKCYRLLMKKNFPLPAIRTLQRWAHKIETKPGFISPVMKLLSETRQLNTKQKLCVLSFDETKLRESFCYTKTLDTTFPPVKNFQVEILRGLTSKWKQLVFYDFNKNMTPDILQDVLKKTKSCGFNVVAVVCNYEGSNQDLFRSLNVKGEKP